VPLDARRHSDWRAEEKKGGTSVSRRATTLAADRWTLPLELGLAALCLPLPENLARAKIGVAA